MSTKQLRINDQQQIRKRISEFLGKKINIVLIDKQVILGELESISKSGVTVKNMRLKKMNLLFFDICEIYFDTNSNA